MKEFCERIVLSCTKCGPIVAFFASACLLIMAAIFAIPCAAIAIAAVSARQWLYAAKALALLVIICIAGWQLANVAVDAIQTYRQKEEY